MAALHLIRHAEPELRRVFLGHLDPPLAAAAIPHARQALGGVSCEVVYSSPLRRARETAALLPNEPRTVILAELKEIGLGEWDGKTWQEIERGWPHVALRKIGDWLGVTPPGGEPWTVFSARVARALAAIRNGPLPAAIVAHQAVNAALAHLLDRRDPISFHQRYCEVITFEL